MRFTAAVVALLALTLAPGLASAKEVAEATAKALEVLIFDYSFG